LTTHLYRPGAQPSNLRSMPSTTAGTAIPITHSRILTKGSSQPQLLGLWRGDLCDAEAEQCFVADAITPLVRLHEQKR
jgi:hypothetical protein